MTILIIEGPEKAGKTTLIREVRRTLDALSFDTRVRKWGPTKVDDREYTPALIQDNSAPHTITIWDRGWASEHVYPFLRGEPKRLARDPWLGEWLHSRAVDLKVILLPDVHQQAVSRRTPDDAQVDPKAEIELFRAYAKRFRWKVLRNDYTDAGLRQNVDKVVAALTSIQARNVAVECGQRQQARGVLFVNDYAPPVFKRDYSTRIPGTWLPFTDVEGIEYARHLGDEALAGTWACPTDNYSFDPSHFSEVIRVTSSYKTMPDQAWLKLERAWHDFDHTTLYR